MEFWTRILGGAQAPERPTPKRSYTNDPNVRLTRFKRAHGVVQDLCNRPRTLISEAHSLKHLNEALDRVSTLLKDEARASSPHPCVQYAASTQLYTVAAKAATVSRHGPIVQSTVAVFAALIDSDEDEFLSSVPFAKCLTRFVIKVLNSDEPLINVETETAILEVLFIVAAKIRLQPDILHVWFRSSVRPDLEDVFAAEKKSFVGITQRENFPLCYLFVDRVRQEGRIGDFARTGLLYIFEATGRSVDLEEWVVSSDLSTLLASGLGALYSQLSRELSILHPDATLPPVLAMSDYITTQPRATAESAFSDHHVSHMKIFLLYLAFWQDVLDHCRSADVKQTLLDHFDILFLQQLLYPSLLQSSDADAGSSVAVLTYLTALLESLEYPDLIHKSLTYLLAIPDIEPADNSDVDNIALPAPTSRSPNALRTRQSLMLLSSPKDPEDVVEPTLFSLADLILGSLSSSNHEAVFAAMRLTSTILSRHKKYAFGKLIRVRQVSAPTAITSVGTFDETAARYCALAESIHPDASVDKTYADLCEDVRNSIESQALVLGKKESALEDAPNISLNKYSLQPDDALLCSLQASLRNFFTNGVDVNLALTEALLATVSCLELRLDTWVLGLVTDWITSPNSKLGSPSWHEQMDEDEQATVTAIRQATSRPKWSEDAAPLLYVTCQQLARELDTVRREVPNLDSLISGRKNILQAASVEFLPQAGASTLDSPIERPFSNVELASAGHRRSSSTSSLNRGRKLTSRGSGSRSTSLAASPISRPKNAVAGARTLARSTFQPLPPDVPSTTDQLLQRITFPPVMNQSGNSDDKTNLLGRAASLNHLLTNIVILQQFILELVAVLQVRAAVLGDREVCLY